MKVQKATTLFDQFGDKKKTEAKRGSVNHNFSFPCYPFPTTFPIHFTNPTGLPDPFPRSNVDPDPRSKKKTARSNSAIHDPLPDPRSKSKWSGDPLGAFLHGSLVVSEYVPLWWGEESDPVKTYFVPNSLAFLWR